MNSYNYDVKLAQLFRDRDNPDIEGPILGEVISTDPLQISIYNGQVLLTEGQYYICSNLLTRSANIYLDNVGTIGAVTTTGTIANILNVGDLLLCLPIANGQKYFIIDKVVE